MECLQLLTSQLDEQRKYWEDKLQKQVENEENVKSENKILTQKIDSTPFFNRARTSVQNLTPK